MDELVLLLVGRETGVRGAETREERRRRARKGRLRTRRGDEREVLNDP